MINQIKEQLAFRRLKKKLHAQTQIDRAFFASARKSFVALIETKGVAGASVRAPSFGMRYATVAIVALIALGSGVGVFAEKLDVPPTSPLYPIKRIVEQVQLAVSSPARQVVLHQEYAQKRAKEIAVLTEEEPPQHVANTDQSVNTTSEKAPQVQMNLNVAAPRSATTFSGKREIVKAASVSIPASESFTLAKEDRQKKDEIGKLKDDLEKEAELAVSQSESLHISGKARDEVCIAVIGALRQSAASSSERLAEKIQSHCVQSPHSP